MSIFSKVTLNRPRSSRQNLTHENVLSTDFGKIVPIYLEDVVPGDKFLVQSECQLKLLPTLAPIMSDIEVRIDYFFVPNRLIWDEWQDFITGGPDGVSDVSIQHPYMTAELLRATGAFGIKSLSDYFGLPVDIPFGTRGNDNNLEVPETLSFDALPFRAYALIWNEYYRDQNLQDPLEISHLGGEDDTTPVGLQFRDLKKDYFTSALPWTQRGPAVDIPLAGGKAPVKLGHNEDHDDGYLDVSITDDQGQRLITDKNDHYTFANGTYAGPHDGLNIDSNSYLHGNTVPGGRDDGLFHQHEIFSNNARINVGTDVVGTADVTDVSAITINELRRLNAVQKWLEKNARAGSRYVEQILSHFGVHVPDYRLDRPEYLGGNKSILGMAEVFQTSQTDQTPQGNRAGVGYGASFNRSRKFRVEEHGWIMGLMSIIPRRNVYADGLQKKWTRFNKLDYFFPSFQFLGEQAVQKKEVYAYGSTRTQEDLDSAFGYQKRYAEYKYHPSGVHGDMRGTLAYWHLSRLFNSKPELNEEFLSSDPSYNNYDRIFPTDEDLGDRFYVRIVNHVRCRRPMYYDPEPSL